MVQKLPQESENAVAQYNLEQMKACKSIDTNAIYFRLSKDNNEKDILKFFRAMLAQGKDVMGFRDQGVNEDGQPTMEAYRMRRREKHVELVQIRKFNSNGNTGFSLF